MCGIVGIVGEYDCKNFVFDGLGKMQYRGYDSAGICIKKDNELSCIKVKGDVESLRIKAKDINNGCVAIGHTRWATHGKVSEKNAHPILDQNGVWAVVHNGIIENFAQIKCNLMGQGVAFKTQTDSEVIVALLAINEDAESIENLIWACKKLRGSYAICAINKKENAIFVAKNKSPLYLYHTLDFSAVASDPVCFPDGRYYRLEDLEFAKITKEKIEFYNENGEKIQKKLLQGSAINRKPLKQCDDYFMLNEIYETSSKIFDLINIYKKVDMTALKKWWINKVKLIGCGSAYHSCLLGAHFFKKHLKIDAEAVIASEFRYDYSIIDSSTLCIFVSQSGETADTISALEKAVKNTKKIVVLTNVEHSTLSRMGTITLPICAGQEISVASTKAYTCQVVALFLIVMFLKGDKSFARALNKATKLAKLLSSLNNDINPIATEINKHEKVFYIGRGIDYMTAMEGALKLKEVSYINCVSMPAGELKHGTLALIEKNTPLVILASEKKLISKTINNALEAKSRGAKLFLITTQKEQIGDLNEFEYIVDLPTISTDFDCILTNYCLQLLAYKVSLLRGNNPDRPRNLAKSVTVE